MVDVFKVEKWNLLQDQLSYIIPMTITNIMARSRRTVVEYSTHNPKIKSSNPSTDTGTENNAKSVIHYSYDNYQHYG